MHHSEIENRKKYIDLMQLDIHFNYSIFRDGT